ncbi:MAG: LacI family DNA-binding transcriptional regulator [Armatimonadota bacterium]
MTTVRQLAKLANVSIGTVSRALTGMPGVSAALRERIKALAAEYQYRPNRLTQSLFTGKSGILGFVADEMHVEYTALVFEGACEEALHDGYFLLPMNTHEDPEQMQIILHKLIEIKVEGILLANFWDSALSSEQVLDLHGRCIPVVGLNRLASEVPVDRVHTDEQRLAEAAITHLWQLGHREIAICGVWTPIRTLYLRSQCLQHAANRWMGCVATQVDAESQEAMRAYFTSSPQATAIIGCSDGVAAKLMRFASDTGHIIPRDMSIIGCGNSSFCEKLNPQLTTIEEFPRDIGRTAITLLKRRITERSDIHESPITQVMPVSIIKRESCAPPNTRVY